MQTPWGNQTGNLIELRQNAPTSPLLCDTLFLLGKLLTELQKKG